MYYVEKIIDGKLYFRTAPNMGWQEISYDSILKRMIEAERTVNAIKGVLL